MADEVISSRRAAPIAKRRRSRSVLTLRSKEARDERDNARRDLRSGIDPMVRRRAEVRAAQALRAERKPHTSRPAHFSEALEDGTDRPLVPTHPDAAALRIRFTPSSWTWSTEAELRKTRAQLLRNVPRSPLNHVVTLNEACRRHSKSAPIQRSNSVPSCTQPARRRAPIAKLLRSKLKCYVPSLARLKRHTLKASAP